MKPALIKRLQNHFLPKMKQKRAAKAGFDLIIAAGEAAQLT